jgi:secondary thiamine-phosphate synthase enzyme
MIATKQIELDSRGYFSVTNITDQVRDFARSTGIQHGQVLVFYRHTTGAVIIGEHEPGIIADLQAMFERIAPMEHEYIHHLRDVDFNGHAHVRSALMTINVLIPLFEGELLLGTYQEILVIDDQTDPAPRYVVIQVSGAEP